MIRMLGNLYRIGRNAVSSLWRDEKGIGTLEIVLIAAVLILVAFAFKDWIIGFLQDLMDSVGNKAETVFD
jgi:Flp pilus assembly protein TadG